jgi:prepilin-type N-terminal cleavage/methylation domain-containing protein
MMIYSAQTRISRSVQTCCAMRKKTAIRHWRFGFTMTEMVVVIVVVSLFALLAQIHLFRLLMKNTFKAQTQQLVSTMQSAVTHAAQSDKRFEVIIDLDKQSFLLRQITTPDLSVVLDEEVISQDNLGSSCRIVYVEFDDGEYTHDGRAKFRAGHSGWAYGGKIVLIDEKERPYSVVVNRLSRIISLQEGDIRLLKPKLNNEITF